jgi:hypothetical protein
MASFIVVEMSCGSPRQFPTGAVRDGSKKGRLNRGENDE